MTTIADYNARALEARIHSANHPEELLDAARAIVKACSAIADKTQWALDPEESEREQTYWAEGLVESAHELLDLAHDFKHALKAHLTNK